jgi:hypothetical protein
VRKRPNLAAYSGEDGWVIQLENSQCDLYCYNERGECIKSGVRGDRGTVRQSSLVPLDGYEGDDREQYQFTPKELVEV